MRLLSILIVLFVFAPQLYAKDTIKFNRDIKPILAEYCIHCHGPDEKTREAKLRLDTSEGAFRDLGGYSAIKPGDSADSESIVRILSQDKDEVMPPPKSKKHMKPQEIALLKKWIDSGAKYEKHWAFEKPVPPSKPVIPSTEMKGWGKNEIDPFIFSALKKAGLKPNLESDRRALIRRVSFDLTGLPPTPEEIRAFVEDKSSDAYEKVINRLLSSPRYGEHMARYWLDLVRYADTHGLHLDNYREMWAYRDWVINAFNENMPYDKFAIEQIAGDLLPNATQDQLVASGFNRLHVTTNEGGSIKEEVYVRNVVERTVGYGTTFLSLTMDCARCHDHKFDPIKMKDFYAMFAFFNNLDASPMDGNKKAHAPVINVLDKSSQAKQVELDKQIAKLADQRKGNMPAVDEAQRKWEASLVSDTGPSISLDHWYSVGAFGAKSFKAAYDKNFGPEDKPFNARQKFGRKYGWKKQTRWQDGKVHNVFKAKKAATYLYRKVNSGSRQNITLNLGSDDAIKVWLNGKQVFAKNVKRGAAPNQEKVDLVLDKGENHLLMKVINDNGGGGFYFAVEGLKSSLPPKILQLAKLPESKRNAPQKEALQAYYREFVSVDKTLAGIRNQINSLRQEQDGLKKNASTTLVYKERKDIKPAYMLIRGEYDKRGAKVDRATPGFLPPMKKDWPMNRLGLAKWTVDPENPLTARVAVNRFWQQCFGTGLVKTSEDFGNQGEWPSHPELLDKLAVSFVSSGWDVKAMMKQIVMSAAYRQHAALSKEKFTSDPENRLISRGPRFRLDAEMLRDQALAVSGLLNTTMGGPSVKPPQPTGIWFAVGYSRSNTAKFKPDAGSDKVHRRSLYTFWKRTAVAPQMSTFDAPTREACAPRRERTNTPLQALLMMNDPQYMEAARALADRVIQKASDTDARIQTMFEIVTARTPNSREVEVIRNDYQKHLAHYTKNQTASKELLSIGEFKHSASVSPAEMAAWTMVANLLLNLDEVINKN